MANSMKLVVTNAGRDALKNAAGNGTNALTIESVVLGNGRYTPDAGQAWIREEHHRLKTIAGTVTGSRSLHVTVRDESRDRYSVFELGLVTSTGVLFAVYSQNDVIIEKAPGSTLLLSLDIELTDIDVKQITFGDTSFINPAATTDMRGVIELATEDEVKAGSDNERAVTARALHCHLGSVLKKVATTGNINDADGVLTVKHGGTGRDDGNLKADTVYAGALENAGGIGIKSGNGRPVQLGGGQFNLANLGYGVVLRADSGDTLGIESGCAIVGKNDKSDVEFKVQKERLFLDGEDSPVLGRYKHGTFITAKSGDTLSIEPGNAIVSHRADSSVSFKFADGVLEVGIVPMARVQGLGKAATRGVVDTGQPELVGWGDENLASAGSVSGVFYRMTEHGKIGCQATMLNMAENGATAGQVVDAADLRYASCDGYSSSASYPSGRWKCLGLVLGASAPPRSRTCSFVRIQ